jgi:uncharacterized protein YndB with AHSA1/START domain
MGRITIDMTINAPVATVFAYVDDYRNTTKYMKDLVKWQPTGKVTHGRGRSDDADFGGRHHHMVGEQGDRLGFQ